MLTYLRNNMKGIMIAVAVVFAATMFYGLGSMGMQGMSTEKKDAFVKVNGKDVDPDRFNNIFNRLRSNFPQQIKPTDILFLQNMALSQTIDFSIILDEARKKVNVSGGELDSAIESIAKQQKFNNIAELKRAVESSKLSWNTFQKMVRDEILVQKMVIDVRNSAIVNQNDLREIRASHILIAVKPGPDSDKKALALAQGIKNRAQKGESFSSLAKQYSDDPGTKGKGGDLGFFATGAMVKPFEDAAFSAKIGEIIGPIKTDFGYHIIVVTDAKLRKVQGNADVESVIRQEKQEKAFREWFFNLKSKAKVEILDPALKALDLRFKGRLTDAIAEYNKAIAQKPGNAYLHLFLGLLYEDAKQLKQAIIQYKEASSLAPADPNLCINLGRAYLLDKQSDLAVEQFKKASLIAGDNKTLHEELAKTFKDLRMDELVIREKNEIVRIEKKEAFEKEMREGSSKIKTD